MKRISAAAYVVNCKCHVKEATEAFYKELQDMGLKLPEVYEDPNVPDSYPSLMLLEHGFDRDGDLVITVRYVCWDMLNAAYNHSRAYQVNSLFCLAEYQENNE